MFKTIVTIPSLAAVAMLICSSTVYSQISLSAPTQTVGIGANQSVFVFASDPNSSVVEELDLTVQVLAPGPSIVNFFGDGILTGASVNFDSGLDPASSPQLAVGTLSAPLVSTISLSPTASPVAEIIFDTTGLSDGDEFSFGLDDGVNPSTFINQGTPLDTVSQLTFSVTVASVPEPASAGILFALGSLVMTRRKRV